MEKKISFIIPCYNEEKNIDLISESIHLVMSKLNYFYEIIFINDGSTDRTFDVLHEKSLIDKSVKFISFSRNFGKDSALKAGFDYANCDAAITIDADLQHPPELITELISEWENGYQVVYAYREKNNPHVNIFNKLSSKIFWLFLKKISSLELEVGVSDYRIIDKKVVDVLKELNEIEIFYRGIIKWVGFKQKGIPYTPDERINGNTSYSKTALVKLAIQGITSFSTKPLYLAMFLGIGLSAFAIIFFFIYVIYSLNFNQSISGWASVIAAIVFFGGLNLIVLGIVGMYIGKLFMQSKGRPNYIISSTNYK